MQLRKKNPEIHTDVFMESADAVHLKEESDMEAELTALDQCIEHLKSDQQRCVRLFFLKKKSYFEIHELTGLTTKKVKSNIQNGKRNLKICLESKRVEE